MTPRAGIYAAQGGFVLEPDDQRENGITAGLVVEGVSGASARASLQSGELLPATDDRPVASADQTAEPVARSNKTAAWLVQRGDTKLDAALKPE